MKKKLQLYSGEFPDVQLFFINEHLEMPDADLHVLPARDAGNVFGRMTGESPPVICFGAPDNMGLCLSAGCIDYLCLPWTADEFFERVRRGCGTWTLRHDGYTLVLRGDRILRRLAVGTGPEARVRLTAAEQRIMRLFFRNRGRCFGREMITELLGGGMCSGSRKIDMTVSRLRKKTSVLIYGPSEKVSRKPDQLIKNEPGRGWGIM
ncbi:MAG: response regulator transcription factor [Spirochaetales bacterium]|nr:response regulator transcription factor [Spirochaetales bacterium]